MCHLEVRIFMLAYKNDTSVKDSPKSLGIEIPMYLKTTFFSLLKEIDKIT